jgi:hypothetical protein
MDFETFLSKLGAKDRLNVERHVAAVEENPGHAKMWRRMACTMMTLGSHSAKANGQQTMQFYVADGKYRMQVFALEDLRSGKVVVYATNCLPEAIKTKLLSGPLPSENPEEEELSYYRIVGTKESLILEEMDGKLPNPAPFYKDMLGWNRQAIRITLPTTATDVQVTAVEKLLNLSARKWMGA